MKFSKKLFLAILLPLVSLCLLMSILSYQMFSHSYILTFHNFFSSLSQSTSDTLIQLDQETHANLLNVRQLIHLNEDWYENQTNEELITLAKKWNVSHLFTIDGRDGKYLTASYQDPVFPSGPKDMPSVYEFCAGYRELIIGSRDSHLTPLIQVLPEYTRPEAYKFFLFANKTKTKIYEIAIHAEFLGKTLQETLVSFSSISSIGLFAPNGDSLGFFSKHGDKGRVNKIDTKNKKYPYFEDQNDRILFYSKVPSSVSDCCDCQRQLKNSNFTEYAYILRTEVSKIELNNLLQNLLIAIAAISLLVFITSILFAGFLSRALTRNLSLVNDKICHIIQSGKLDECIVVTGKDEIAQMGENFNRMIQQLQESLLKIVQLTKDSAIIGTIKTVAHDIRRPFSLIKGLLHVLGSTHDPTVTMEIVKTHLPEVENAIIEADAMLEEIMEIGREITLKQEPIEIEAILFSSLAESCQLVKKHELNISYYFNHKYHLFVDHHRCQRVFSNIITNALQHIQGQADLWFRTDETDQYFIKFCIGNNGSYIEQEDIPHIFEPFYTRNSDNGTGLGLSIASRFVKAHGGKIWCKSSKQDKIVEFFLTLPTTKILSKPSDFALPKNTSYFSEAHQQFLALESAQKSRVIWDPMEFEFEKQAVEKVSRLQRIFVIGVVEDEKLYQTALKELIDKSAYLNHYISLVPLLNAESALKYLATSPADALICDIDLGKGGINGFELVKTLRRSGYQIPICIHSNRCLPEDYEAAIQAGAQSLLPKPMSKVHLLKFILASLGKTS